MECRPECVQNIDCPKNQVCFNNKCKDPCPGLCAREAECTVINHIPTCTCPQGLTGDPFVMCTKVTRKLASSHEETFREIFAITAPPELFPCNPSPCGPNSQCREVNKQAVCSCLVGYMGAPPNCRPECVTSFECPSHEACINQKCVDPCPGTCGTGAKCQVINHNPICSCPLKYSGDPFVYCSPIPGKEGVNAFKKHSRLNIFLQKQGLDHRKILVFPHLVVQIHDAILQEKHINAFVYRNSLEFLRIVDQNALLIMNVQQIWHV